MAQRHPVADSIGIGAGAEMEMALPDLAWSRQGRQWRHVRANVDFVETWRKPASREAAEWELLLKQVDGSERLFALVSTGNMRVWPPGAAERPRRLHRGDTRAAKRREIWGFAGSAVV
jgi:hypothetical protein